MPADPHLLALGESIRRHRLKRGLTQEDAAHEAGLTVAAYGRIERAQADPRFSTLRRIASALDVSVRELVPSAP